jgi:Protein of unknown function (DUF3237)
VSSLERARNLLSSQEVRASDGAVMRWGEADAPAPPRIIPPGAAANLTVAVSPARLNHSVTVDYRVAGGPVREVAAIPARGALDVATRLYRAILPGQSSGPVEFLPVLRLFGRPISPRLANSAERAQYRIGCQEAPIAAGPSAPPIAEGEAEPRWSWRAKYLYSLTAAVQKEIIGVTPDGLRIAWRLEQGRFEGPLMRGVVLPGATDWMRIREDGVATISVNACLETDAGARIYVSYGGLFDLGPDGYARALRGAFDPSPPLVIAPTFQTSEKSLLWLNRVQCFGVGRGMRASEIAYDAYFMEVGGEASTASREGAAPGACAQAPVESRTPPA